MLTALTLTLAAIVLALLAVAMGWVLGWANKTFHVEVDAKIEAINEALPGANCGGCGYVGCNEYAEAVAAGEAIFTLCGPGGASAVKAMSQIMGVEAGETFPIKAVVHCGAKKHQRKKQIDYIGEQTCTAASFVSGIQGCAYGCLGLGDCVDSCEYDAIHIIDGLAEVHYGNCVGCKACAIICPVNIISMVPYKAEDMYVLKCSNRDFGKDVKEVCEVGCIGCSACAKLSDFIEMDDKIPVIDYSNYKQDEDFDAITKKCPPVCLGFRGKGLRQDVAVGEE